MTKIGTIRFLKREELDILKYDELINNSQFVSIYCYSWYLDAVSDNWGALVQGNYESVFPIIYTVKFGQSIIYQPFFTREIALFSKSNTIKLDSFLDEVPKSFKKIDFGFNFKNDFSGYSREEAVNQELSLIGPYEDIYKNYSTNTKRLIKKAIKANCLIEESHDVDLFISFFKSNTGERVNYSSYDYSNLEKLITVLLENKKGKIYQVLINGGIVAQGIYMFQDHRVTYLKGSIASLGKKNGAMFLLMNELIKLNAEQAKVFDFGGSKIESIATFYKKFGAKDRDYFIYSKNEHSWILKKGKKLRDLLKK